jgi:Trk-type K+ transport system membrane component
LGHDAERGAAAGANDVFGREIPDARLRAAVATMMFYILTLSSGVYARALVEKAPLPGQLFESASALGTVGLSRSVTGDPTDVGKTIINALMFPGRVGPVLVGMAFFQQKIEWGEPVTREGVAFSTVLPL